MSASWDDAAPADQRDGWLLDAMALLSLDATRAAAGDLALMEPTLAAAQPELRRVLGPPFRAHLAAPAASFAPQDLAASLEPSVHALVRSFYDGVIRYAHAEPNALFCWGILLTRCARDAATWASLGLPPASSGALRDAFLASGASDDLEERADAALAEPLSAWDRLVAALRLFPPLDDDDLGISVTVLYACAKAVRRQGFWRAAADRLGAPGLRALRERGQAVLAAQEDIAPAFGRLHDPWLLGHPELTAPDGAGLEGG